MNKEELFELLEASEYLPKLPESVSQIIDMLNNPMGLDIDQLTLKVASDQQLNKLMMENINSGYFQLNRKVFSIKEAIVYLGMQTVQNLLIFFITRQLFPITRDRKDRTFNMAHYWKHVMGTSVASWMLSSRLKTGDKYKLFTYGLIHDIGIAVLDVCQPDLIDEVFKKLNSGVHQLVAERIVMGGVTHSDIGAWLCRKWNIREDITAIVEYHHTPFLAKENTTEIKLIHVADVISSEYFEKLLGINLNHGISNNILKALGLTLRDKEEVSLALPEEIDKLGRYFYI